MVSQTVTMRCWDGEEFVIDEAVALESEKIKNMISEGSADDVIPLPRRITSETLSKVIEYCKKRVQAAGASPGDPAMFAIWSCEADLVKDHATLSDVMDDAGVRVLELAEPAGLNSSLLDKQPNMLENKWSGQWNLLEPCPSSLI